MNVKYGLVLLTMAVLSACASKKEVTPNPAKKTIAYPSRIDLLKNEQCDQKVESVLGDRALSLKPTYFVVGDTADLFCVQKLPKGQHFLRVSSALEPMDNEKNPVPNKKFLATAFDLVIYDQKFNKVNLPKPVYRSPSTNVLLSFYDFSKEKKFPAYVMVLFHSENHEKVIFSREMLPSENALIEHSANAAAAGMAMGGFAAGSAASTSQPKSPLRYSIYARSPVEVKADWVSEIPVHVVH